MQKTIPDLDNYVFDLYGTLIDIRTDEEGLPLWSSLAGIYSVYGADYTPSGLRSAYRRICREEERELGKLTDPELPEIELKKVFARLLTEAPETHETAHKIGSTDELAYHIANNFRVLSRQKFRLYPYVRELLQHLKNSGKRVYMLSNAQAVFTVPEIEQAGIGGYFDEISISSDAGIKKPNEVFLESLIYKHSLDRNKTVMIGNDYYADMQLALGCAVCGIHINSDRLPAKKRNKLRDAVARYHGCPTDMIYEVSSIRELYLLISKSIHSKYVSPFNSP